MATVHEMGKANENEADSNDGNMTVGASVNGDISCEDGDTRETPNSIEQLNCDEENSVPIENIESSEEIEDEPEKMDVDEIISEDEDEQVHEIDNSDEEEEMDDECQEGNVQNGLDETSVTHVVTDEELDQSNEQSIVINDSAEEAVESEEKDSENNLDKDVEIVDNNKDSVQVIADNRDPIDVDDNKDFSDNGSGNDSGDDVVISESVHNNDEVITLEDDQEMGESESRRRSSRNVGKFKKQYSEDEVVSNNVDDSEESDIEEVLPEDPLAVIDDHPVSSPVSRSDKKKSRNSSSTIVVKDTKCLAEIASKSTSNSNSKKEPTLVIIDTNSILSGRGPVPIAQKPAVSTTISNSHQIMPVALPAQGVYPANMRATITPIPMSSTTPKPSPQISSPAPAPIAPLLPTLSDDMFVVEAPSFIVPYVYEKPPIKDLQQFIKDLSSEIPDKKNKDSKIDSTDIDKSKSKDEKDKADVKINADKDSDEDDEDKSNIDDLLTKKSNSYFDGPLGKFFMGIGYGLVQEMVQADLLRQQKRKREREGNQNPETTRTINSLLKNLEFTKENNAPYHMTTKKCEFCTFKTESSLVMSHHLETPHMKNFIYRCNYCSYEVRSPHDILVHIEVLHGIRGRLERAPCYHQCPNCPFEDNQKGKLSRHLVSCARKFKPERNLEPLADFEPPAKIPRAPRMKQQSLGNAAAVYQAMARNSQFQMMSKMPNNLSALQRNRGRPSLGTSIKPSNIRPATNIMYKTGNMSGGSVLVPTNYQLSGNQLYQVVGGQEISGCLYPGGATAFAPSICANPNSVTFQNQGNKSKNSQQPSISITPLPRGSTTSGVAITKMGGDSNSKNSFVICEICDGYIKDLEQLRNHMQWIHKVKIHPKMINNRPPLNCQKCQFRFFTDQGLERHLLGSHGLVTSSMQEAANKSKDAGRCPVCGRVYQWKLLNHVARDHNMTLKPAHLSYKCTVCTATFGMYKQFESHVYSAHSMVAKRAVDKKGTSTPSSASSKTESVLKPLKINDEITIIPQPSSSKSTNGTGGNKEGSPSITTIRSSGYSNGTPTTSKILGDGSLPRSDRLLQETTLQSNN